MLLLLADQNRSYLVQWKYRYIGSSPPNYYLLNIEHAYVNESIVFTYLAQAIFFDTNLTKNWDYMSRCHNNKYLDLCNFTGFFLPIKLFN